RYIVQSTLHYLKLYRAPPLLLLQILAAFLDVDMIPRQHFRHRTAALRVPGRIDSQVGERLPPNVGLEGFLPTVQAAATAPRFLQGRRHTPVAARQYALQEAALDIMLVDAHRADAAATTQILAGPAQVLSRLHSVPLIRRMRLGHEVRNGSRYVHIPAENFFAD